MKFTGIIFWFFEIGLSSAVIGKKRVEPFLFLSTVYYKKISSPLSQESKGGGGGVFTAGSKV